MDYETLRSILPIATGRLSDFREKIRSRIILSAIKQHSINTPFSADDIKNNIIRTFNFTDYALEIIISELDNLVVDNILQKNGLNYVLLRPIPEQTDYNALLDEITIDFEKFLRKEVKDFNPYDYEGWKITLRKSVEELTMAVVSYVNRSEPNICKFKIDEIPPTEIIKHWKDASLKVPQLSGVFMNYLHSDSKPIIALISGIYEAALTVDMLSRGKKLKESLKDAPPPDRIYLDTNCLSSILNPTNRYYSSMLASISIAQKFGFQIGYLSETSDEMYLIINSADKYMKIGNVAEGALQNEFISDFAYRCSGLRWPEYITPLKMWSQRLATEYGIIQFEKTDISEQEQTVDYFETAFLMKLETRGEQREPDAITHDILLYSTVQTRKGNTSMLFDSPLIETLDRVLCDTDNFLVKVKGYKPSIKHVSSWLNLLSRFLDASFEEDNVRKIGMAILQNIIQTRTPSITIEEYSHLLAARHDWEPKEAKIICQLLTETVHQEELEKALRIGDIVKVTSLTEQVFRDEKLIEEIVGRQKVEKENARLILGMHRIATELISERKMTQLLLEMNRRPITVSIQIQGVPNEAIFLLERIIEDIEKELPEVSKTEGIDKSILNVSDEGGFKSVITKIEGALTRVSSTIAAAQPILMTLQKVWQFLL